MAQIVNFGWNANPEPGITDYKLYAGRVSGNYDEPGFPQSMGNVTRGSTSIQSGIKMFFSLTALIGLDESGHTSELLYDPAPGIGRWLLPSGR